MSLLHPSRQKTQTPKQSGVLKYSKVAFIMQDYIKHNLKVHSYYTVILILFHGKCKQKGTFIDNKMGFDSRQIKWIGIMFIFSSANWAAFQNHVT